MHQARGEDEGDAEEAGGECHRWAGSRACNQRKGRSKDQSSPVKECEGTDRYLEEAKEADDALSLVREHKGR